MTDLKISQFVDGGAIQETDEIAAVRAGVNTKVFVGSMAAEDAADYPQTTDFATVAFTGDAADLTGLGTAALLDTGTGPTEVPLNSDLGSAAYLEAGDGIGEVLQIIDSTGPALPAIKGNLLTDLPSQAAVSEALTNKTIVPANNTLYFGGIEPGGRLTLTSNTPVLTTTTSAQTTVYYTPYKNNIITLYDGTGFRLTSFTQLSQATTDTTKSPAAVANNSNYDIFVWNDSGTLRATRGPAWTSDTGRGTGAGTTELVMVSGVYLNAVSITNGPASQRGTYVGTIRSNGSASIDWIYGAAASGGTAALFNVWNMYNRVDVATITNDTTATWNYTTATWRAANASNGMRVSFVRGLNEDAVLAQYHAASTNSSSAAHGASVGLDSTSAPATGAIRGGSTLAVTGSEVGSYNGLPGLGFHYLQAIEWSTATGTTTWVGNGGGTAFQTGLLSNLRA